MSRTTTKTEIKKKKGEGEGGREEGGGLGSDRRGRFQGLVSSGRWGRGREVPSAKTITLSGPILDH